jgi:hypothetical protein
MDNIPEATLVVVCYACCGDAGLKPRCKRCAGTGADPNPGPDARIGWLEAEYRRMRGQLDALIAVARAAGADVPAPQPAPRHLQIVRGGVA